MLDDIGPRLVRGQVIRKVTIRGLNMREGDIAEPLGALAKAMPDVSFGSYPWFRGLNDNGVHLVASMVRADLVEPVAEKLMAIVKASGVEPERVEA